MTSDIPLFVKVNRKHVSNKYTQLKHSKQGGREENEKVLAQDFHYFTGSEVFFCSILNITIQYNKWNYQYCYY